LANYNEIADVVASARGAGCDQLALLHCVSAYPAAPEDYNLRTIPDMAESFDAVVGLSDHTLGTETAVAAVALGANIVEKHLTLSRADGGPDSGFSLEPAEFAALCQALRTTWGALGNADYARSAVERENLVFRRSLYAVTNIAAGEALSDSNIRSIRPGFGLPIKDYDRLLGRRAKRRITRGTPLSWDLVE